MTYSVGRIPRSIAIGDIDADGVLDIVASNSTEHTVSVLLGMGDGTFQQAVKYPLSSPGELTLADVDGDGRDDVIVTGTTFGLGILFGQSDGGLSTARHIVLNAGGGGGETAVAVGDVNRDGGLDIAITDYTNNEVVVLFNAAAVSTIIAHGDRVATTLDKAITTTGNVLANDIGAGLNVTDFDTTSSKGGFITKNADNTFTYQPPTGFLGVDAFAYTIADSLGRTDSGTITVAVLGDAGGGSNGGGNGGSTGSNGGSTGGGGLSLAVLLTGLLFAVRGRRSDR